MNVYTYSEARQNLAAVLDAARRDGKVLIKRRDGSVFCLMPEARSGSPLDVPAIDTDITTEELLSFIREGRRRGTEEGES